MAGGGGLRAYIGSFTTAGGRGILTAAVDPDGGALTVLGAHDGLPDPSWLAVSGDMLYAVSERPDGAVAAYRRDGDRLEPAGPPVPVGDGPTHVSLHAGHLLTADYGSGGVTAVPLRAEGAPAENASDVLRHRGSGPDPERQEGPHAHQVQSDPSGRWVVSVDLGTDSVRVCALQDGSVRLHRETPLPAGSGPRHLAFHPDGDRAYVLNELTPTVTVCRWDAGAGILEPVTEAPVLPQAPTDDAYPSGIVVSSDGRFVWTATRGQDLLSVLTVEDDGLRLMTTVPCGGVWPRAIALSEGFLYIANERSGDVTWFALDRETGLPRRGGSVEAPAASCVVFG
ncbi:lactonase family protein [Streptomyces gibsoniae]|uniref:Lactonase family protein n=1 Tax=Streptomyces gibsoniae TaxID=3075529 RepID=A0ABU2U3Q8_9ACTN|nr:lactonase family protein [Streptomyces sp. DSM 41699]MDT0467855.1 lactonase family protein [Streptomyces sp. DSM 41699]